MKQIFATTLLMHLGLDKPHPKPDLAEAMRQIIAARTEDHNILNATLLREDLKDIIFLAQKAMKEIKGLD